MAWWKTFVSSEAVKYLKALVCFQIGPCLHTRTCPPPHTKSYVSFDQNAYGGAPGACRAAGTTQEEHRPQEPGRLYPPWLLEYPDSAVRGVLHVFVRCRER